MSDSKGTKSIGQIAATLTGQTEESAVKYWQQIREGVSFEHDKPVLPDYSICEQCGGFGWYTKKLEVGKPGQPVYCENPTCPARKRLEAERVARFGGDPQFPPVYNALTLDTWAALPDLMQWGKQHAYAAALYFCNHLGENFKMSDALTWAGVTFQIIPATFQNPDQSDWIDRLNLGDGFIIPDSEGNSLGFLGSFGTGKSGLAVAVARELFTRGKTVVYLRVSDFIRDVQATYSPDYSGRPKEEITAPLTACDLLVLDEFGVPGEIATPDKQRIIQDLLIAPRWKNQPHKPIIYTTNHDVSSLYDQWGGQAVSRINEMCHPIYFGGASLRRQNW